MNFRITIFTLALLCGFSLKAIDASISYATFSANGNPYVEVYFSIIGSSVAFAQADVQNNRASVEITILFKQGDKIVKFDKYNLNSPLTQKSVNFVDQKRYPMANGEYTLDITLRDLNQDGNETNWSQPVSINYSDTALEQSDIQLLGAFKESEPIPGFTKNGYYLETLPFNFYSKKADKLGFYNEIYNTDKAITDDEYLIRYYIDEVGDNNNRTTLKLGHKKREPSAVNVILLQMDIKELASGNYYLVVEVRDRAGELRSSKEVFFQRSNPYLEAEALATADLEEEFVNKLSNDELVYSLKAIAMLVPDRDVEILNYILSDKKPQAMRNYLFSYYAKRNPNLPEQAYQAYMKVARAVDKTYKSGLGYGFETDRGNIFLKYGKPNNVVTVEDEPAAPPYEIWIYEDFPQTAQSRVKFIFYNPSLAGGHFRTLHSTARGELNNPQWEIELYSDAPQDFNGMNSFDSDGVSDNFRRQARRLWDEL